MVQNAWNADEPPPPITLRSRQSYFLAASSWATRGGMQQRVEWHLECVAPLWQAVVFTWMTVNHSQCCSFLALHCENVLKTPRRSLPPVWLMYVSTLGRKPIGLSNRSIRALLVGCVEISKIKYLATTVPVSIHLLFQFIPTLFCHLDSFFAHFPHHTAHHPTMWSNVSSQT